MSEQQPPPEGRQPISREGKIGIFLGLVGLLGAGAIMVAPQQVWIGWTLIGLAALGFVLLFAHHVSSTVAPPRPKPSKASGMTVADAGFLLSLGASAVALVAAGMRHRWAAIIAALVACLAVSFDFVDRQWLATASAPEMPLSADNARVEIRDWVSGLTNNATPKQYATNLYTINKGKHDAIGMRHSGIILLSQSVLQDKALEAFFPMLKAQINLGDPPPKARIEAGSNNVWYTILSGAVTDDQAAAITNGTMVAYVLNVMQYRDDITPENKFIYTESCIYYIGPPVHICSRGDNVPYISD